MAQDNERRTVTQLFSEQQGDLFETSVEETGQNIPVECLGQTFESDEARREHYLALRAEKLKDPEFRKTPGFPKGTDEAILRLSDPPYYTACPNPFVGELVNYQQRRDDESYNVVPYATDVAEGKRHPLYEHISYHTKVPHKAIAKFIHHYTRPGDLVVDLFCGSGMTGLATKAVREIASEYAPDDGERSSIVSDLSPYAAFMAYHFNKSVPLPNLEPLFRQVAEQYAWMYETVDATGVTRRINYTVWSDVFLCRSCSANVVFFDSFVDEETGVVRDKAACPG